MRIPKLSIQISLLDFIKWWCRKSDGVEILHCPRCNSTDIYYEAGLYTGRVYHCKKCDYSGPLIIVWDGEGEDRAITPGNKDTARTRFPTIPLWIKILAVVFLMVFVILGLK